MKRLHRSSDSLSGFLSVCHSPIEDNQISQRPTTAGFLYAGAGDCSPMFNGGSLEDATMAEKKRRLSAEQVKALEKNFEIDNKLEPERKVRLAKEVLLQPRQVAIWFQNRRARWKTKQLESDYGVLKSNFDSLKRNRESLQRDNDTLLAEIKELRAKLNVEGITSESNGNALVEETAVVNAVETLADETLMANNEVLELSHLPYEMFSIFPRNESLGEDPTDSSDSSAVLNEGYSPTTVGCFSQFVKIEEHEDLFSGEEACKLFEDNEQWLCSGHWDS